MPAALSNITPAFFIFSPVLLWLVGIIPGALATARPHLMSRLNVGAAWLALFSAISGAAFYLQNPVQAWNIGSYKLPGAIGDFSIGVYMNTVTLLMLALVSFVGAIVSRYASNYLKGDPNQGRFHKWLSLTLASILTLIVSGNLLMFSLAWISTSLCLHQLLMFYSNRPSAVLSAHKKFIASRIGDVSLLIAIFLIGTSLHTLEFNEIFEQMSAMEGEMPASLQVASLLIVLSAVLKSAQFPLHGWLIQVMEAPTPVSALLHAGIVNAGAFLVIRMSPVMSHSNLALAVLASIGLVTLFLASLVMLTQTSIKVSLAWSTTAQMGFMLLECGLGLYSLAMLHLVAHSLYKAHAFLASGSGVEAFRAPYISRDGQGFSLWKFLLALAISLAISLAMSLSIGAAFGLTWQQQPELIAAGTIVTLAISQLMFQSLSYFGTFLALPRAIGLSGIVCIAYFILHELFDRALHGSVLPLRDPSGAGHFALVYLTIAGFIALSLLEQFVKNSRSNLRDSIYIHLYNGLYIDVFITRILQRIWPAPIQSAH